MRESALLMRQDRMLVGGPLNSRGGFHFGAQFTSIYKDPNPTVYLNESGTPPQKKNIFCFVKIKLELSYFSDFFSMTNQNLHF